MVIPVDIGGSYVHVVANMHRNEHVNDPVTQAKPIEFTECRSILP
jgi:hypothetical protein